MKTTRSLTLLTALLLSAPALHAQDWKGQARVEGVVRDETGNPIAGAKVQMHLQGRTDGPSATTNKSGRWALLGLRGGPWDVDITADGYIPKQLGGVPVKELERIPPIEVKMAKMAQAPPQEQTKTSGGLPPDIVEAVKQGDALMKEQKWAEAAAEYEKAAANPTLAEHVGLLMQMARAYHGAKQEEKSVETLKKVLVKEPDNVAALLLLGNASLEKGDLEAGKAYLDKVPASAITDPTAYINVGILYMNKKKPAEAEDYFGRAVAMEPNAHIGYYYRGLARVQGQKWNDAKADLKKVVELAPDSPEAKEAKELLGSMK
jgi:tetratricopeptide (TPR) repeat protein